MKNPTGIKLCISHKIATSQGPPLSNCIRIMYSKLIKIAGLFLWPLLSCFMRQSWPWPIQDPMQGRYTPQAPLSGTLPPEGRIVEDWADWGLVGTSASNTETQTAILCWNFSGEEDVLGV